MIENSVTLIRPPYVTPKKSVFGNRGVLPIGLAYLNGSLRELGAKVTCIDAFGEDLENFYPIENTEFLVNGLSDNEIISRIPVDTTIIGISCMFSSEWINTIRLLKKIKLTYPKALIVLGGEHATAECEFLLKTYPEIDVIINGEGEEKFKSLVSKLNPNQWNLDEIEGISYLENNNVIHKKSPYRIKEIDKIALPCWEGFPVKKFLDLGYGHATFNKRALPMVVSRGCPYRCTFCSSKDMWTTRWIARDIDLIIQEIKFYIDNYQINHIDFYDLTLVVNKEWTKKFCERILSEGLDLTWSLPSGTRSEALSWEILALLRESGCEKITYAPETGSSRLSYEINKRVNLKKMLCSIKNAAKLGFVIKVNIIIGLPGETYLDLLKTYIFIVKLAIAGAHDVPCFNFTPYPGSLEFKKLLENGKISRNHNYELLLANMVFTKIFNSRSWNSRYPGFILPFLNLGGMLLFYSLQFTLRPWRLFSFMKNIFRNHPSTMMEALCTNLYRDFVLGRRIILNIKKI